MQSYANLWWSAARQWAEILSYSPLVIGERVSAIARAGAAPSASHQAEMARMVTEKGEAMAESATALWLATLQGQQLAWQRAWAAGRAMPVAEDFKLASSTARRFAAVWNPVSRRVTANARRLARRKRRVHRR